MQRVDYHYADFLYVTCSIVSKAIGLDICTLFARLCIKVIFNQWLELDYSQGMASSLYLSAMLEVSSSDWAFFILELGKLSMRIYLHTQKNSKLKQSNSLLKKFKALPVLEYMPWLEQ